MSQSEDLRRILAQLQTLQSQVDRMQSPGAVFYLDGDSLTSARTGQLVSWAELAHLSDRRRVTIIPRPGQ